MTAPTASQPAPPRRRWCQFSLRSLLVFVTLVVLGLVAWRLYVAPYREERRVMALVEQLGGRYTTQSGGPAWLRKVFGEGQFQQITLIDVPDAKPEDYLGSIIGLPRLETLVVGGDDFTDQHLAKLGRTKSLRAIVLDSTEVTDEAIAELRTLLPDLIVHRSQRRDIADLRRGQRFTANEGVPGQRWKPPTTMPTGRRRAFRRSHPYLLLARCGQRRQ